MEVLRSCVRGVGLAHRAARASSAPLTSQTPKISLLVSFAGASSVAIRLRSGTYGRVARSYAVADLHPHMLYFVLYVQSFRYVHLKNILQVSFYPLVTALRLSKDDTYCFTQ